MSCKTKIFALFFSRYDISNRFISIRLLRVERDGMRGKWRGRRRKWRWKFTFFFNFFICFLQLFPGRLIISGLKLIRMRVSSSATFSFISHIETSRNVIKICREGGGRKRLGCVEKKKKFFHVYFSNGNVKLELGGFFFSPFF